MFFCNIIIKSIPFRDMLCSDSFNKFNEIVGHSNARNILFESTILPLQYPELFASVGNGWKCTLLHGPPGEISLQRFFQLIMISCKIKTKICIYKFKKSL